MSNDQNETTPHHRGRKFRGKKLRTSLPKPQAEHAPAEPRKEAERIAKVMARAGVASRREAEEWVAAGRVSVNGKTINSAALNVAPSDRISVDGKPLPERERTRLFMFHKPRGVVTTSADTHDRPTIYSVLPKDLPRLVTIGRLDINTEGLLLLTNDGGLARALELPATGWLRRYRVRAFGSVTQDRLDGLRDGITVDGVNYGAIEATLDRVQGSNVWITFAMREGKNREIRNVLRALDMHVNRLIRVSYGPFQLGELAEGAVEEVKTRALREQIGSRLAAQAGADFSGPLVEQEEARASAPHRHSEARGAKPRASREERPERRNERPGKDRGRPFEARQRRDGQDDRAKEGRRDFKRGPHPGRHAGDRREGDRADARPHRGDRPGKDRGRPFEARHRRDGQDDRAKGGGRDFKRGPHPDRHAGDRHAGDRPDNRPPRGDRPGKVRGRPPFEARQTRNAQDDRAKGGGRDFKRGAHRDRRDGDRPDGRPPRDDRPRRGHRPYHGKRDR